MEKYLAEKHLPVRAIDKIRFDNHIAASGADFVQYGREGHLMFNILVYIAYCYQQNQTSKDLFGWETFDINDFCQQMGYYRDKSNLFRYKKDNLYERLHPKGEKKFYKTVIGNALYRLAKENLELSRPRKNVGSAESTESFQDTFIQLLQTIEYDYDGEHNKCNIRFKSDKVFIASLTQAFVLLNKELIPKMRVPGLEYIYSYFVVLKSICQKEGHDGVNLTFRKLVKVLDIHLDTERYAKQAKQKVNKKLYQLMEIVAEDPNCTFSWEPMKATDNSRYKYGYAITWIYPTDYTREEKKEVLKDAFTTLYKREFLEFYIENYPHISMEGWEEWLSDNAIDREKKIDIYVAAYNKIFKKKPIDKSNSVVKDRFYG